MFNWLLNWLGIDTTEVGDEYELTGRDLRYLSEQIKMDKLGLGINGN